MIEEKGKEWEKLHKRTWWKNYNMNLLTNMLSFQFFPYEFFSEIGKVETSTKNRRTSELKKSLSIHISWDSHLYSILVNYLFVTSWMNVRSREVKFWNQPTYELKHLPSVNALRKTELNFWTRFNDLLTNDGVRNVWKLCKVWRGNVLSLSFVGPLCLVSICQN